MSGGAGRYADRDRDRGRRDRSLSPRANKRRREGDYDRYTCVHVVYDSAGQPMLSW